MTSLAGEAESDAANILLSLLKKGKDHIGEVATPSLDQSRSHRDHLNYNHHWHQGNPSVSYHEPTRFVPIAPNRELPEPRNPFFDNMTVIERKNFRLRSKYHANRGKFLKKAAMKLKSAAQRVLGKKTASPKGEDNTTKASAAISDSVATAPTPPQTTIVPEQEPLPPVPEVQPIATPPVLLSPLPSTRDTPPGSVPVKHPPTTQAPGVYIQLQKDQPSLKYTPAQNKGRRATMFINGRRISLAKTLHPVTISKLAGVTPRHKVKEEWMEKLEPIYIKKGSHGEVVHVEDDDGNNIATVMFASADAESEKLQNVYEEFKRGARRMLAAITVAPRFVWNKDDLGGGEYVAMGYGSIPPGPKRQRMKFLMTALGKLMVPYKRRSANSPPVRAIADDVGLLIGAVAEAWKEASPEQYSVNSQMADGSGDCVYPSEKMQGVENPLFANQFIVRTIGKKSPTMELADQQIALHTDDSDYSTPMPLIFTSHSANGSGGVVPGSDLLVFEGKNGGRCVRVQTCCPDTVVIVIFNSVEQLHGGVGSLESNDNSSIRIIPYCRGPIVKFLGERKKMDGGGPVAFEGLEGDDSAARKNKFCVKEHRPIDIDSLAPKSVIDVCLPWGKGKKMCDVKFDKEQRALLWVKPKFLKTPFTRRGFTLYHRKCGEFHKSSGQDVCSCWGLE